MPESTLNGTQANGHSKNGKTITDNDSVTDVLAEFVVNTSKISLTDEMEVKLKALLLDYFGVTAAAGHSAESTPKILAAVEAFSAGAKGNSTILTKGSTYLPQYAALVNGALCHSYDFDDTHSKSVSHPGCSLISAALAEAETLNSSGADLLLALAVGYEVACRLGIALGNGTYRRGFHSTSVIGIYGSIAAVCKLRASSLDVVTNAFGLAVSKASGSMQFLENGSWNKRLHPGFAAHDALLCVSLAEAGIVGAAKPIEGKYGLLHNFSEGAKPAATIIEGLGSHWTLLDTACKPFPACRMTHGLLESADNMRKKHSSSSSSSTKDLPKKVTIHLPKSNYPIVGTPSPNKINPKTIVDGQFSAYFQTATAYLYGSNLGWSVYDHIGSSDVNDFCNRITIEVDDSYTNLETKLKMEFEDGTVLEEELIQPLGEPERPFEWDTGVKRKFVGLVEPIWGKERCERVVEGVDGVGKADVRGLLKLLA